MDYLKCKTICNNGYEFRICPIRHARGFHVFLFCSYHQLLTANMIRFPFHAVSWLLLGSKSPSCSYVPTTPIPHPPRTDDAIITSLLCRNDAATSFWHTDDVIISSCWTWEMRVKSVPNRNKTYENIKHVHNAWEILLKYYCLIQTDR